VSRPFVVARRSACFAVSVPSENPLRFGSVFAAVETKYQVHVTHTAFFDNSCSENREKSEPKKPQRGGFGAVCLEQRFFARVSWDWRLFAVRHASAALQLRVNRTRACEVLERISTRQKLGGQIIGLGMRHLVVGTIEKRCRLNNRTFCGNFERPLVTMELCSLSRLEPNCPT
jgi:hypothetical protein